MQKIILVTAQEFEELIESSLVKVLSSQISRSEEQTIQAPPEILHIDQAAELLNLAKATIYCLTSKGKIPHFKTGKKLYFKRSELLEWIEANKRA